MDVALLLTSAALVVVAVRLVGWLVGRLGQPSVVGEIAAGILLGPSVLGLVWPENWPALFPAEVIHGFQVLAQFGLVLFMMLVGLELDSRLLRGQGRKAAVISMGSVVLPFGLGLGLGVLLYPRFGHGVNEVAFCLFLGAAVSITAFPVLARILQEAGIYQTRVGALAIACAAINDVIAWCLLAGVVAVATAEGPGSVALHLGLSVVYVVIMLKIVRPLLSRRGDLPLWAVLTLAFLSAGITESIGIHAIFGAFLAGVVLPRDEQWQHQLRSRLEGIVAAFVLPMFFVVVGVSTRLDHLGSWAMVGFVVLVTLGAVVGKVGGAVLAARAVREPWPVALSLGVLMNTRGLTEIVILTVGLQIGVIDGTLFTIMVIMALGTTVMTEPLMRLLSRRSEVVWAPAASRRAVEPQPASRVPG